MRNKKLGPIEVCLTRDQVNAMLIMLDTMIVGGYECSFGDMASSVICFSILRCLSCVLTFLQS